MIRLSPVFAVLASICLFAACDRSDDADDSAPSVFDRLNLPTPTEQENAGLLDSLTTAFGDEPMTSFDAAETKLGWTPLCSTDQSLQNPLHGLFETEAPSTLPRLRLLYNPSTSHTPLVFIQQPDTYPLPEEQGTVTVEEIGPYSVRLWELEPRAGASFATGEAIDGHQVMATVFGKDFGLNAIRDFIDSLITDCD